MTLTIVVVSGGVGFITRLNSLAFSSNHCNPGGAAYGFAQTPSQSLLERRIDSPLPNLGFASAWTFPGGGFTGAIMSGYLTVETLLTADTPSV